MWCSDRGYYFIRRMKMVTLVTNNEEGEIITIENYVASEKENLIGYIGVEIKRIFGFQPVCVSSEHDYYNDDIYFEFQSKDVKLLNKIFSFLQEKYEYMNEWTITYIANHKKAGWNIDEDVLFIRFKTNNRRRNRKILINLLSFLQKQDSQGV